jgi:uncharacterized DUF497 family protein
MNKQKQMKAGILVQDEKFIWDEEKNKANIKKHKVTFSEAATVFDDDNAVYFNDETHSQDEERFIVIGFSERARMLMVCHCYRNEGSLIRIISARKADREESEYYTRG